MEGLIAAFNATDLRGAILSLILVIASKYAAEVVAFIGNGLISVTHSIGAKIDETAIGKKTEIDNTIIERISEAIEATMPIAEDFKKANEDGKLTAQEIAALKEKAWNMFVSSLGIRDWINFGLSYIPGYKASKGLFSSATPRFMIENKMKEKFLDLHVKVIDEVKQIKTLEPATRARKLLDRRFK